MAIDVKAILCPQCGSTAVHMMSETQGVCESCGVQFTVRQRIDTQNVYNEIHIQNSDESSLEAKEAPCGKYIVSPEFSKEQFLRKVWTSLAKEDAPLEIFNEDFGEISVIERQILFDLISVNTTYQASVGYDRQEPYIGYETITEKEPYIAYERHYNISTQQKEERQVTKYKDVEKQREVTKYKTVIDWRPISGKHSASSAAVVDNIKGLPLDNKYYASWLRGIKPGSISVAPDEIAKDMHVNDNAHEVVLDIHHSVIASSIRLSLPGDHNRDLDWSISDITSVKTALYIAPEYEVSISFNGKTYTKSAFPFGRMEIHGNKVKNNDSLNSKKKEMEIKLSEMKESRKDTFDKTVSTATNKISSITITLLAVSIIVSLFIRSTALVISLFAVAVAAFIYNTVKVRNVTIAEAKRLDKEIEAETTRVNSAIAAYSSNHKAIQQEALNKKLISLGLETVEQ